MNSPYQVKSLGYRTDFIFNRLDGAVTDCGDYLVAETNSNPNYFWGNLILFKRPPVRGDLNSWKRIFKDKFKNPAIYHMTFAWDSPEGEIGDCEEFLLDGFELEQSVVLTCSDVVKPLKFNPAVEVRKVDLHLELNECVRIQVACAHGHLSKEMWQEFYQTSMENYQRLISEGHGDWYGAYIDGVLVGTLGLFIDKDIGRFQIVSTDPSYQRLGVCSTLVYEISKRALESGLKELVMVADEDYHAAKIYESVGFIPNQKQVGLCWWDREKGN